MIKVPPPVVIVLELLVPDIVKSIFRQLACVGISYG